MQCLNSNFFVHELAVWADLAGMTPLCLTMAGCLAFNNGVCTWCQVGAGCGPRSQPGLWSGGASPCRSLHWLLRPPQSMEASWPVGDLPAGSGLQVCGLLRSSFRSHGIASSVTTNPPVFKKTEHTPYFSEGDCQGNTDKKSRWNERSREHLWQISSATLSTVEFKVFHKSAFSVMFPGS